MQDRLIYESAKSKVFHRKEKDSGKAFAVKVLNYEYPTPEDISHFFNEFDIINGLELPGIRNAVRKVRENNRHVLVMEWVDGESVKDAFVGKREDIVDILHIAVEMAEALAGVHSHQIIHKDVTPYNFVVDLQARSVRLIDFGISTNLNLKQSYIGNPERIEGTLAYVSPEQTGRTNRIVDYRSDLYSLGATLYEMLTGGVPFVGADATEMVHAHIAQIPTPIHRINPTVPEILSDMVAKLLAKSADDRYQSAQGLKHDLERCLKSIEEGMEAPSFSLGEKDHSSEFRLPQRLYGREEEVKSTLRLFEECADGKSQLLLVGGYSGTGKTSLVYEVHKPITARSGFFCSGKFDQFQREIPYFAFLEALRDLVDTLLTFDEANLAPFRDALQEALGEEGKVLTNVLPKLEHIIGEQPSIPSIGGTESQNRFHYVFRKFIHVFCTREHPLVIFIDDLQWADSASLDLLHLLMTDPESSHLLLVCAYRSNEVSSTHPFLRTVDEIREAGIQPATIEVGNLLRENVVELLGDALDATDEKVASLADLVYEKTRGNAFFATEFLKSLAVERLLQFDFEVRQWVWNSEKIRQKNIAENVVELMSGRVNRLSRESREILEVASCIGNRFDLESLRWAVEQEPEDTENCLRAPLRESLLIPLGPTEFKFSHDRIQQAVYSNIALDERERIHLKIGRGLEGHVPAAERAERIFDIVSQLNKARSLLTDPKQKKELASMNLQAGSRAKLNSAFPTAFDLLGCGIEVLAETGDPWVTDYSLTLKLYTEATEAAYLSAEFEQMDVWFREILDRSENILEKVKPYETRILAYKAENRFVESIQTGLEVLDQLGEPFPENPTLLHVLSDLVGTQLRLTGKTNEDLMALPLMDKPEKMAAMRIIADITSSVYWAGNHNLVSLIAFRMVRLSLRYGNHPVSCFGYGAYGVIMCGVLGAMRYGYRFGKLALSLLDKLNAKEWKAQIFITPYALIFHWNQHVRENLRPLQQAYQIGMETGAVEFACADTNTYCIHSFLSGRPLERVAEEARAYSELYRQFNQETIFNYNEVFRQAMLNLLGRSVDPCKLIGDAFDEQAMLIQNRERNDKAGSLNLHLCKLLLACLFHRYEEAERNALEIRKVLDAGMSKYELSNYYFYESLSLIALSQSVAGWTRTKYLARARIGMAKLKRWARFAPENFQHKFDLCAAEWARIKGRENKARTHYDLAISGASSNEFLHEQALAYELAGRFYIETERIVLAEFHLQAAYSTYREWGATAKLRDLGESYPKYLFRSESRIESTGTGSGAASTATTSMIHTSILDINSVLKASTIISSEVVPARLLEVLIRIILESAGAERGFLMLDSPEGLRIQARGEEGGEVIDVKQNLPLQDSQELLIALVQFVHRTGESIVVAEAKDDTRCAGDPYLEERNPRSILVIPIVNQGKEVGILYLENNLTAGAFTYERVDLLRLLSGQIAVSIENSTLYEQLEQKVVERTAELEKQKEESEDLLHNILPVETAQELKENGFAEARYYERVTVLFTDFKGFTAMSERLAPAALVQEIDECFRAFDHIIEKYRIEKIKTIGDAYMAVGGLPVPNSTHAENVIRAALEIRDFIRKRSETASDDRSMQIRVGVHTGPVVAGVVGSKKFQYDVWGDTVNTASRMESSGEPDQVNVSSTTYELVKERFEFTFRGEIEAKGKGKVPMYFVEAREESARLEPSS